MRCVTNVVVTFLALLGLTGVACRLFISKETLRRAGAAIHAKFGCHHHGHHDDHHVEDEPPHHRMPPELIEAMRCHEHCSHDKACREGCPVPWKFFEEKCDETLRIMGCHKACGRNHTCHVKCPSPRCPHMQHLVNATLKCHGSCASGDCACHHACPKPFRMMKQRCVALRCHKKCGVDRLACRHECPELTFLKDISHNSNYGANKHHGGSADDDDDDDDDDNDDDDDDDEDVEDEDDEDDEDEDDEDEEKAFGAHHHHHHHHHHDHDHDHDHDHFDHHDHHQKAEWGARHGLHQKHGGKAHHDHARGRDGDNEEGHRQPPPHHMRDEFLEVMRCHEACSYDKACHDGCPMPWKFLEEKCDETLHIMACHKACLQNHTCHVKCPLPRFPRMQRLVNTSLECHGSCASADGACHHACPKPLLMMKQRCDAFKCHKECGFNRPACQRECPELLFGRDLDLSRYSHRGEHEHRSHDHNDDDGPRHHHNHHQDEKALAARHHRDPNHSKNHDHHNFKGFPRDIYDQDEHFDHDDHDQKAERDAHHRLHEEVLIDGALIEAALEERSFAGLWQRLVHGLKDSMQQMATKIEVQEGAVKLEVHI